MHVKQEAEEEEKPLLIRHKDSFAFAKHFQDSQEEEELGVVASSQNPVIYDSIANDLTSYQHFSSNQRESEEEFFLTKNDDIPPALLNPTSDQIPRPTDDQIPPNDELPPTPSLNELLKKHLGASIDPSLFQ